MKQLRQNDHNLSSNMHVRGITYQDFYQGILDVILEYYIPVLHQKQSELMSFRRLTSSHFNKDTRGFALVALMRAEFMKDVIVTKTKDINGHLSHSYSVMLDNVIVTT